MTRLACACFATAIILMGATAMSDQKTIWPDLPAKGFLTGRVATPADVERGDAIFSTNGASKVSSVAVPQYAYWRDEQGRKHPRIVAQAEDAPGGLTIVGLRDFVGAESAATIPEMELFGVKKPN